MERCVNALKQWTGKTRATIVFDSTVDEFTHDGLFEKVKGKPNTALIGFTTDGDVFGAFYSVTVTEQVKDFYDPNIFIFSFESRGRCMTPQRFVLMEEWKEKANVHFWKKDTNGFVSFWVNEEGGFYVGNEESESYCWNMSDAFEGLEYTTLTGNSGCHFDMGPFHHCTRLVAVHLS